MMRNSRARAMTWLLMLPAMPVMAQSVDLAAAEKELQTMFARPEGTVITAEQKQRLVEFLQRHEGQDLGHLGYARALDCYFRREPLRGAAILDEFFAKHDRIENPEHATMAGRIYLVAMREAVGQPQVDNAKLLRWAEHTVAQYGDLATVGRLALQVVAKAPDAVAFRLALVRGLRRSTASDAVKDAFLAAIYAEVADGGGRPSAPASDVVPTPGTVAGGAAGRTAAGQRPAEPAGGKPATGAGSSEAASASIGSTLPDLPIEHALGVAPGFRLEALRGKVVVLDFFATWCPPCREGIAELLKLQADHKDVLQVVGVTRFYGRGMDFGGGATKPHGGRSTGGLSRPDEIKVNETFAKVFAIDYPLVFTTEKAWREAFAATAIPMVLVVGRDGRLLGRVIGNGDEEKKALRSMVEQALR